MRTEIREALEIIKNEEKEAIFEEYLKQIKNELMKSKLNVIHKAAIAVEYDNIWLHIEEETRQEVIDEIISLIRKYSEIRRWYRIKNMRDIIPRTELKDPDDILSNLNLTIISAGLRLDNMFINIPNPNDNMEKEYYNIAKFLFKYENMNFSKFDSLVKTCKTKRKYLDLLELGKEGNIGKYDISYDDIILYKKWFYKPVKTVSYLSEGITLSLGVVYDDSKPIGAVKF